MPWPGTSSTSFGRTSAQPALGGRGDDGAGQDVRRDLIEGGRQPQHLAGVTGAGRDDVDN